MVTTASTGNAAAALAGLAASVGLQTIIFVPASAPEAKIAQLLVYGAHGAAGRRQLTMWPLICAWKFRSGEGWYCRSTGINPFTTEGKKPPPTRSPNRAAGTHPMS
jgi:threonine synthase